jgi:hypothetical protein
MSLFKYAAYLTFNVIYIIIKQTAWVMGHVVSEALGRMSMFSCRLAENELSLVGDSAPPVGCVLFYKASDSESMPAY